jgi:hypothetical protein
MIVSMGGVRVRVSVHRPPGVDQFAFDESFCSLCLPDAKRGAVSSQTSDHGRDFGYSSCCGILIRVV